MNVGIVICSRANSSRIPNKPFQDIYGKPLIQRLLDELDKTNLKVILAVPCKDRDKYITLKNYDALYSGYDFDPLQRMYAAADMYELDVVIRVCHDKIFVDPNLVHYALKEFNRAHLDYLYSDQFTEGSGFEIISIAALKKAADKFSNIEHISYAIRAVTNNTHNYKVPDQYKSDLRLLVDFPEDLNVVRYFYKQLGYPSLETVLDYYQHHKWIRDCNKMPDVTVYTCAYNSEEWIEECMESVLTQTDVNIQYILIDDCSKDSTHEKMLQFQNKYRHLDVTVISNDVNLGLSSSCNIALRQSRGKYLVRLDSDDYFAHRYSVLNLYKEIENTKKDVIYPNNFYGSMNNIQKGNVEHHIGGAIFNRRAINHIKFTDKLRNLDGLDFFERAKDQLKIGYLNYPVFFYRQRPDSMSKTNLEEREGTKKMIMDKQVYIPDTTVAP